MIPYIQYGLGVYEDGVYIRYQDTAKGKQKRLRIESVEHFAEFVKNRMKKIGCKPEDLLILCSSSMDFPEQYTKSKKIIKLANDLR